MNTRIRHRNLRILFTALALAGSAQVQAADAAQTDAAREQAQKRLQEAQQRLDQAAREVAELSMSLNDGAGPRIVQFHTRPPRAMLGMSIAMDSKDKDGVLVTSVSPGGPAESAGIKANDTIVSFGGKALSTEGEGSAAQQLLAAIGEAKPGEPVAIEYSRAGKKQKVQVTPREPPDVVFGRGPDLPPLPNVAGPGGPRMMTLFNRELSGFGAAELVELSPQLGKYFGTEKGLLVVRAPHDDRFKLQDGDVILDIDGRMPSGVAHAFQILNSYRAGEKLKMHIMRQQKKLELPIEVPAQRDTPAAAMPLPPPGEAGVVGMAGRRVLIGDGPRDDIR